MCIYKEFLNEYNGTDKNNISQAIIFEIKEYLNNISNEFIEKYEN